MRGPQAAAAAALSLTLVSCGPSVRDFDTAQELFDAAGGEQWCGTELRLTVAPWVGSCGDGTDRVVISVSPAPGELASSLGSADGDLVVLVRGGDPQEPGWQLRADDAALLREAQEQVGGLILEDRAAIDAFLEG